MRDIYTVIRKLGATSKYKGYYFVTEAVMVARGLDTPSVKITKDVYPVLAKRFCSKPSTIEHNMRTLIHLCWRTHREEMEKIAGCSLGCSPTNSEFLDILVYYLNEGHKQCPNSQKSKGEAGG